MAEPFIAEIRIFAFNFAPRGYAFCNGQILPISQNTALFSLLGTTYGGNGQSTFALPNLQGNAPMHWGNGAGLSNYVLGETAGSPTVTLVNNQIPTHNHAAKGSTQAANAASPSGLVWGAGAGRTPPQRFQSGVPNATMLPTGSTGGGQPHNNMQPYLAFNFCIALIGVYPARN